MTRCPKCGAGMIGGFVLDNSDNASVKQSHWAPGEPRKSFWSGLKVDRKAILPITTLRCERCGFLESYARPRTG